MNAVRIYTRIDSETLHLPELRSMIGKEVEIIVVEEVANPPRKKDFTRLDAVAGKDLIDPAALKELRDASMI